MKDTSIQKIVFDVRGKRLELSADEAKELKQILSDLFGETKVVHEYQYTPSYIPPYRPWTYWSTGYSGSLGQTFNSALQNTDDISNHPQTLCLSIGN